MSCEFRTLGGLRFSTSLFRILGFLSVVVGAEIGIASGLIVVDTNIEAEFYLIYAILIAVALSATFLNNEKWRYVTSSALILFYAFLTVFSIPYLRISVFFALALVIEVRQFNVDFRLKSRKGIWMLSFSIALTSMILISGLLRGFPSTQGIGILVGSISDDVTPGGTPLMFLGGLVFFTRYLVFSISLQALLLFTALSILLVENYFLIIEFVRKNSRSIIGGQVSGALTVLSCQCESITAAFPSIVSLILSAAIIPLILESIFLVFLTNLLLRTHFMKGRRFVFLDRLYPVHRVGIFAALSSAAIITLPLIETVGVYFNWQTSLYFYGGINFLMLIAGILAAIMIYRLGILKIQFRKNTVPSMLLALASFAMLAWFYPPLTLMTVQNGGYFALMSIVSFAGGILSGFVYSGLRSEGKRLFLEFLAMMFTMFAIVVFYFSILSGYSIWPVFGLTEQVIFSIGVWVVTLPFMWFATNIALNSSVGGRGKAANAA